MMSNIYGLSSLLGTSTWTIAGLLIICRSQLYSANFVYGYAILLLTNDYTKAVNVLIMV